jgi:hypothetical protein
VHQSASLLIPLFSGRLDVVSNLRFESFSEHPPGSGSGDLVEIEQESFVLDPNLMYPLDRCTPSRRRANVGSLFDCSKGRYTTLKRKSPIHNFRLYLGREICSKVVDRRFPEARGVPSQEGN